MNQSRGQPQDAAPHPQTLSGQQDHQQEDKNGCVTAKKKRNQSPTSVDKNGEKTIPNHPITIMRHNNSTT